MTLPEFGVLFDLYEDEQSEDYDSGDFIVHFEKMDRELVKYEGGNIWIETGDPESKRFTTKEIRSPMARLVHKIIVSSFVHLESSQEKVHTLDL